MNRFEEPPRIIESRLKPLLRLVDTDPDAQHPSFMDIRGTSCLTPISIPTLIRPLRRSLEGSRTCRRFPK
ncbi:MAG TPA: hypothetical protein DCX60_09950 [Phycisphaerales bacterium]|nr:hypothetical protein [Phycisphaerales bacterium]